MKKIITGILTLTLFTFSVNAQIDRTTNPHSIKNGRNREDIEQKLNLTESQKTQVKVINDDIREKMMTLKNSTSGTDMSTQRQALMQEKRNRIAAILTPEQKVSFDQQLSRTGERGYGRKEDSKENAGPGKGMDRERAAKMQSELGLSADQSARLKESNQSFIIKMKAIKENQSLSQEQKMQQFKALQAERQSSMKNILTADQLAKYEKMKPNNQGGFKEKYKNREGNEKMKIKSS